MTSASAPARLDALLSRGGYCSRSEAKGWIRHGRVTVRGAPATAADQKARPDEVRVDGEPLESPAAILAVLHKPAGCVCSRDGREGPSVFDLLPPRWSRRNPPVTTIGRLDKDTTGVLLISDLGELVQRWTSPRHKVVKVYEVTVDGEVRPELVPLFASGTLQLVDELKPCLPAALEITGPHSARLELVEGRYHQVKRMFASQGLTVTRLHRSRVGEFQLDGLAPGEWRLIPQEHWEQGIC